MSLYACAGWGQKEKSTLPVFGGLIEAQPDTQSSEHGVTTVEHGPVLRRLLHGMGRRVVA